MEKLDVVAQSKAAYGQWKQLWRNNCDINKQFAPFKNLEDFINIGVGKSCLLVANGYSFEKHLETIKAHQDNVDILCCDKTLGHLLDNGIKPTYCILCDAQVNYKKYMEKWKDQLGDTILFMNVCGNPEWSTNGNWKDKYFFVNQDVIESEKEFSALTGSTNFIPAATNVSNAMVVFMTQSNNDARRNYFGYDRINLIGFDYSWTRDGKYYSFNKDGDGKSNYMRHIYTRSRSGSHCFTSGNLLFSARWLAQYVNTFTLPVVQCDQDTLLDIKFNSDLEGGMQYNFRREDGPQVMRALKKRDKMLREIKVIEQNIETVSSDHYNSFVASL